MPSAISSAVPSRPSGILAPAVSSVSRLANFSSPGVSVQPGWMMLMRMSVLGDFDGGGAGHVLDGGLGHVVGHRPRGGDEGVRRADEARSPRRRPA